MCYLALLSDFFRLDLKTRVWTDLSEIITGGFTPPPMSSHGLAFLGRNLFLHGGMGGYNSSGEEHIILPLERTTLDW